MSLETTSFSASATSCPETRRQREAWRLRIDLPGVQVEDRRAVLGLIEAGSQVFLLEDALFSSEANTGPAIRRMEGAGAIPSTVKTLNYELRQSVAEPRAERMFPERFPGLALPEPEQFPPWTPGW